MPNTNCLEGIACPECKSEGPFAIHSCALVLMSDNGGEETTDIEWSPASVITCKGCGHFGKVRDFTAEPRGEENTAVLNNIDLKLLLKQKRYLLRLVSVSKKQGQQELLDGVINLLDHIHDQIDPPK